MPGNFQERKADGREPARSSRDAARDVSQGAGEGLNSFCDIPLISRDRLLGVFAVARREENAFDEARSFLTQVANQVAIGVENALAYTEIADLKDRLAQEKLYLEDEMRGEMDFEGIVGQVQRFVMS